MPLQLDDYDVSILRSLLKDGRKSFREISRETGITTPTVKATVIEHLFGYLNHLLKRISIQPILKNGA